MEKPTTDKAGSGEMGVETVSASQDTNNLFRTGGVDASTGARVSVGAGMDARDKISPVSGPAHGATISIAPGGDVSVRCGSM
jgi:hypothetical protein